jgi:hypothetical protein
MLERLMVPHPKSGRPSLDLKTLPVNHALTKIGKSLYWLNAGADVLQRYNPGWRIRARLDTSKQEFIENHLRTSYREIHWRGRFITRFNFGRREEGTGGFLLCSLHFYTNMDLGKGMSWFLIACPTETAIGDKSIYEFFRSEWGEATIRPRRVAVCRWFRSLAHRAFGTGVVSHKRERNSEAGSC